MTDSNKCDKFVQAGFKRGFDYKMNGTDYLRKFQKYQRYCNLTKLIFVWIINEYTNSKY